MAEQMDHYPYWETPKEGEWVQPVRKGYLFRCCDCDLVHRMDFRIYKGRVQFRVYRDNEATGKCRSGYGEAPRES